MTDTEILTPFRQKIDQIDDQIVDLLSQREGIIHQVAAIKHQHNIPAILQERVDEVRDRCTQRAADNGSDSAFMAALYTQIIQFSCHLEQHYMDQENELK